MEKDADKPKRTLSYVKEVFRLVNEDPYIKDIVILNQKGNPVKTSMEMNKATTFGGLFQILLEKSRQGIKKLNNNDELVMLRVRTKNNETLVVPDEKITVMVVQNARDEFQS